MKDKELEKVNGGMIGGGIAVGIGNEQLSKANGAALNVEFFENGTYPCEGMEGSVPRNSLPEFEDCKNITSI